jgi:hypothetical protein
MLVWCFFDGCLKIDRFLKWYFVFLFFQFIAAIATGFLPQFFSKLMGTYLAAIVLYLATKNVILKYKGGLLIICTIVVVGLLNSVVCIGQFYGSPLAITIPQFLHIDLGEEMMEFYENNDDFHGLFVGGLMGIVSSGYFLSAAAILSLYNKKGNITFLNWMFFALILFGLFLVQERAGFYFGLLCVFLYYVINTRRSRKSLLATIIVFVLGIFVLIHYGGDLVSLEEMRYSTLGTNTLTRRSLFRNGWLFFMDNPLGGYDAFEAAHLGHPHNLIMNSLLYGGLMGGIVILCLIGKQLVIIFKILHLSYIRKKYSLTLVVFCLAYFDYTLISLLHNASLVAGTPMFFLLWGAVSMLLEIENATFDSTWLPNERSVDDVYIKSNNI